jgi:hypothetical protein
MATEASRNGRAQDPRWSPSWLDWNSWKESAPLRHARLRSVISDQTCEPVPRDPWYRLDPWDHTRPDAWKLDNERPQEGFDHLWGTIPMCVDPDGSDPVANRPPRPSEHLAATLHRGIYAHSSVPVYHSQTEIRLGGVAISVDTEIAGIVELLNRNAIPTLSSCCEEEDGYGFVMFALDAAQEFLRFWTRSMRPQGWELPVLSSFELRDESWRLWMADHCPPPVPFSVDENGHTYTTCWAFPSARLAEIRGPLCDALRQALRSRVSGHWSWAAALPHPSRQG